jgi:hypothetical protein
VTPRQATGSCAECIDETQAAQFKQHVPRRRPRDEQSICSFRPRERDQTLNYWLAFRRCFPSVHGAHLSRRISRQS